MDPTTKVSGSLVPEVDDSGLPPGIDPHNTVEASDPSKSASNVQSKKTTLALEAHGSSTSTSHAQAKKNTAALEASTSSTSSSDTQAKKNKASREASGANTSASNLQAKKTTLALEASGSFTPAQNVRAKKTTTALVKGTRANIFRHSMAQEGARRQNAKFPRSKENQGERVAKKPD
jgi:hypothetical protein